MTGSGAVRQVAAARALGVDRMTVEAVRAFDNAALPYVLLKGVSIARWLYPTGGRSYGDADLLVPSAEFGRAKELLRSMGFDEPLAGFAPFELDADSKEWLFVRPPGRGGAPGKVDLHFSLNRLPVSDGDLWEAFDTHAVTLDLAGTRIRVLDTTALALHVVVHAVQHSFAMHTAEDLRRAVDTLALDGWSAVADLAVGLGIDDIVGFGLRHEPAGAAIADALGLPTLPPHRQARLKKTHAPRGSASIDLLHGERTLRGKLLRIRWAVVPTRAKLRYVQNVPDATGRDLAAAYVRYWRWLARTFPDAWRYVRAARPPRPR